MDLISWGLSTLDNKYKFGLSGPSEPDHARMEPQGGMFMHTENSDSFLWESYQLKIKGKIDCLSSVIRQIRIGMLLLVIYHQNWKLLGLFIRLRRGKMEKSAKIVQRVKTHMNQKD